MAKWGNDQLPLPRRMEAPLPMRYRRQVLPILAAMLVMASVGTLYAWSVFVVPIELAFGQSRAATSLVFSVATAAFTIGMLGGPLVLRGRSPQAIALLACLMAASGLVLSATAESVWLIVLGFGVLFGLANGFAYGSSLEVAQHASPAQPGLFTGIAVASYMLGSVVGSPLLNTAIEIGGLRVALLLLGAYLAAAGILAFLLLRWSKVGGIAHADTPSTDRRAPFGEMAVLWTVFLLSSLVGVMTLAHAAPLAASLPGGERHPALAAALVALGNGVGRLVGGWLTDRLSPRVLLAGAPGLIGTALAAVLAVHSVEVLLAALCIVGVGYGCIAGCLPAIVARSYGADSLARLYGRLFTAWGLAGVVGPYLGGVLYDGQGDYELANAGAAVTAFAAALLGLAYKRTTTLHRQAREAK